MATQQIEVRVVDKTQRALGNIDRRLGQLQGSLLNVNKVAGLAAAALGAIGGANLVRSVVGTIRKFEDLSAQLVTITGSSRTASVALGEIRKFASQTPFTVDEVTNAFVILKRNGLDATTESLRAFGNVAAANGKSFNQLAEAVADAAVGEFERLKEFGIKVSQEQEGYAVRLGNTLLGTVDNYDQVIEKVRELGAEGGRFGEGIANRAATLSGALSNLQDTADGVAVAFGEGGFKAAFTDFVQTLNQLLQRVQPLAQDLGEKLGFALFKLNNFLKESNFNFANLIEGAKIAGAVLGGAGLLKVITSLANGVKTLTLAIARNPLGLLAVAAASLITYLSMENGLGRTISQVRAVMAKLGEMAGSVATYFKGIFAKVIEKVTEVFDNWVNSIIDAYNWVAEFTGLLDPIEKRAKDVRSAIADVAVEGFQVLESTVSETIDSVEDWIDTNVLASDAAKEAAGIVSQLTQEWQNAGMTYDEATQKAYEQYQAQYQLNNEGERTPVTLAEIEQAMGATSNATQAATDAFKKFSDEINYVDPQNVIDLIEKTEQSLRDSIKLQTENLKYYKYRNTEISNNRILFLAAEEEMYNARMDYIKKLDDLETNALRRKMEKYAIEKGAIRDLMNFQLTERERGILQNIGGQERLQSVINDRIEFEKKSDFERYQFGIQQAGEFFSALGQSNKKAFEAAKAFNIANAIMNTYAGATKALATYPPPFNFIAAAAVVASGLAQVAAIRQQQYQGYQRGGALTVGEAAIVGEAGPELIVPKQPSTVIPREVAQAIEGMGGGSNENVIVNFNISTVDAEGFDELLIKRRGTITGIINQALQKRGKQGVV